MRTWIIIGLIGLGAAVAKAEDSEATVIVQASVELRDGSRLVGKPEIMSLPMDLEFSSSSIPLSALRQCEVHPQDGQVILSFQNGDRLTGRLKLEQFKIETSFGKVSPDLLQIKRMTFTTSRAGALPAGEGSLEFGGINWLPWKTLFEVQGDKVVSLPQARPGFNYGHGGSGRGPVLISNIGNQEWRDYRIEADYCVTGTDPNFNPYGVGSDYQGGAIFFHVADAKENWNQCGNSLYAFRLAGDGTWDLVAVYNDYCATSSGWGNPHKDAERKLAAGSGLIQNRTNGNHYRIEVRGQRIQIWVDDKQFVDVVDDKMSETIGGQTLDHGGIGFVGGFDAMIWIKNFSATKL